MIIKSKSGEPWYLDAKNAKEITISSARYRELERQAATILDEKVGPLIMGACESGELRVRLSVQADCDVLRMLGRMLVGLGYRIDVKITVHGDSGAGGAASYNGFVYWGDY